jgi:hypothetical protein
MSQIPNALDASVGNVGLRRNRSKVRESDTSLSSTSAGQKYIVTALGERKAAWKVFMIFNFQKTLKQNNKRENESAQFCQEQTLNRKQDPTKPKRKIQLICDPQSETTIDSCL